MFHFHARVNQEGLDGVVLLIGSLIAHLAKEMQESKVGEEHAHKEYTFISEPAASRAGKVNELDVLQDTMASVSMSLTHSKEEAASAVTRLVVLAVGAIFWALVSDTGKGMCRSRRELDLQVTRHLYPVLDCCTAGFSKRPKQEHREDASEVNRCWRQFLPQLSEVR